MANEVPDVRTNSDYTNVSKVWGSETWIVNNDKYCGKMLNFSKGHHTSMHFHSIKHETMLCVEGKFMIVFINSVGERVERHLEQTESIIIEPNTPHEIWGVGDFNLLFEFSTQHLDSDSYRVGKSE